MFDNRLGAAPPNDPEYKVGRVLDVGTGSGIWAIDFGDDHPESEVRVRRVHVKYRGRGGSF